MGLTQAQMVFIGAHEDGINDLIKAICTDRPRLLLYRSPAFGPAPTVQASKLDPIAFPGVAGGIEWRVRLSIPEIDLHKQSSPLPPELNLQPGQFSGRVDVEICLDCRTIRIGKRQPPKDERERERERDREREEEKHGDHPLRELTCWRVQLFLVGHIEPDVTSDGQPAIALVVDAVELVDVHPDGLESLLECLLFMIVQAALAEMKIPSDTFAFPMFTPVVGPFIEDDQIKLRGNI